MRIALDRLRWLQWKKKEEEVEKKRKRRRREKARRRRELKAINTRKKHVRIVWVCVYIVLDSNRVCAYLCAVGDV